MKILVFDPSGNFYEGKGTTGWAMYYNKKLTSVGQIRAVGAEIQPSYWAQHIDLIEALSPDIIVMEDYLLQASKARSQIGSTLETPQLIGAIKLYCYNANIELIMQPPSIKSSFPNKRLIHRGILSKDSSNSYYAVGIKISRHIIDAIRHGEYYINFKLKEK